MIIDGDGYIYQASEYYNLMPRPYGWINFSRGEVYGEDYGSVNPRPIAYIRDKDGVKEIYEKRPEASLGAVPFLYIANGQVYTREAYYKVFGGSASAYVKEDAKQKVKEEPKKQDTNSTENAQRKANRGGGIPIPSGIGGGAGAGLGFFLFIVAFLALGKIFDKMVDIMRDPKRLFTFCLICIGLVLYVILLAKLILGVVSLIKGEGFMKGFNIQIFKGLKQKFSRNTKKSKPKAKATRSNASAYTGPTTYQHTCGKCGKRFNDHAAHNSYCDSCRAQAKREAQHAGQYTAKQASPEEKKIFTCPKCRARNRVPAGKGRIVITCGNRNCRNRFVVES